VLAIETDVTAPLQWFVVDASSGEEIRLEQPPEWGRQPVYWGIEFREELRGVRSPSGRYELDVVADSDSVTMWLRDTSGVSPPRSVLVEDPIFGGLLRAQWATDEQTLAFTWGSFESGTTLSVYSLVTGWIEVADDSPYIPVDLEGWRLSPDGTALGASDGARLWILSLEASGQRLIGAIEGLFTRLTWSIDGTYLYAFREDLRSPSRESLVRFDTREHRMCELMAPLRFNRLRNVGVSPYAYDVSPDGFHIAFADSDGDVAVVDLLRAPLADQCTTF
jgi:hypothetical protein